MQVLASSLDYTQFLEGIARAPSRVLLLDYDGTLAPFRVRPEEAVPYPEVLAVIDNIMCAGGTRVVIVSGRPAAELPPLLALTQRPEIWGSHGWERLQPDGTLRLEQPSDAERAVLDEASAAVGAAAAHGARVERKSASVAVHWRGLAPDAVAVCRDAATAAWRPYAEGKPLELLLFDGGLELRSPGCNKQHAVKAVLSETPQNAAIAFLGDDITDEDAFRAIRPRGLAVLVRDEFRPTDADVWLRPPQELIEFLRHWIVTAPQAAGSDRP